MLKLNRRQLITGAAASAAYIGLQPEQVRAQSPCGNFFPTVPAPAAASGFNNLVFADDFNVAGTIGPATATNGFNWYLWNQCNATLATNALVLPATSAAQVSNGNVGGGSFASPMNGILQLNGPQCGSGNITITSVSQASGASQANAFYGGYIEAYIQLNPNLNTPGNWYAWWLSATNRISYQGFPQVFTEIDVVENYCGNFSFPTTGSYASCKEWGELGSNSNAGAGQYLTGSPGSFANYVQDSNWHKFGFRWVTTGSMGTTSSGNISFWIDDVQRYTWNNANPLNAFTTGPSGNAGARYMNFSLQTLFLGGPYGTNANMNVDYVRVWQ